MADDKISDREIIARAISYSSMLDPDVLAGFILAALAANGRGIVSREPTKEMIAKGLSACEDHMDSTQDSYSSRSYPVERTIFEVWRAMFDASVAKD